MPNINIKRLESVDECFDELTELIMLVVEDGASIGFLPPLERHEAQIYWQGVPAPEVVLYAALIDGKLAGSVQLHLCMKRNGDHRAEIAKLMTHPDYRRQGVGRALMEAAEAHAKQVGRSLLVLDTREGDPSNLLYQSLGYVQAGRIPDYAKSASGRLDATVLYYKSLL
jgi:ribosomal protein S18 acetylase RimI-like enzyme